MSEIPARNLSLLAAWAVAEARRLRLERESGEGATTALDPARAHAEAAGRDAVVDWQLAPHFNGERLS